MKDRLDIIGLGAVAMDYYLVLDSFSRNLEKIRARSAEFFPGGTMGNFACAAAKLGLKTGFVGVVGRDRFGDLLRRDFERNGVDVSHLRTRSKASTPVTVLIMDDSGIRVNILPPFMRLKVRELEDSYLAKARVLHTHLFDFDVCLHCARVAEENGAIFSLDLELHRLRNFPQSKLGRLLALTQVLFCNRQTLAHLVPRKEVGEGARLLRSRGPRIVVVTLGEEGSLAVGPQEKVLRVSPAKVDPVDPTGAGDCFAAAFSYGYLRAWPLEKTMQYASAASARVVTQIGARTGQPTMEQLLSFRKSFPVRRISRK